MSDKRQSDFLRSLVDPEGVKREEELHKRFLQAIPKREGDTQDCPRCAELEAEKRDLVKHNYVTHELYETGDEGCPDQAKDWNGEVVLGVCKNCGRVEAELAEPCDHRGKLTALEAEVHALEIERDLNIRQCDAYRDTVAQQAEEIQRLQREVVNRNQRALDGDKAVAVNSKLVTEIEQQAERLTRLEGVIAQLRDALKEIP